MHTSLTATESIPVPLLDLKIQYRRLRDEIQEAIGRVSESQQLILGPEVEALEQEVARYSHCQFGIGVSSGTDALLVSLMAIDIKPGDEVITTPYSFFATAGSIARLGATPVFVDIDPKTFNMLPEQIEARITKRTRAVMPVHLFGQMAEMDMIMEVARRHQLHVIEDAAQAIGAEYKGRRAGSLGDLGCFSFYPTKNLGGFGDGGMVTTNNSDLAERIRSLRNHGYSAKYYNKEVGGNFRLDAIQAAVLRVKLKYLDEWTEGRQRNAKSYCNLLAQAQVVEEANAGARSSARSGVRLPTEAHGRRHIYNQFVIGSRRRDELQRFLTERRIGTEIYYPVPLHLQECFVGLNYGEGDFPHSERAALETLALPIYPELTAEQQSVVVQAVKEFFD
ncbi:MAG TPA: DegT/DnrJ/EryC1/StrS family aminotransferase [Pyrinomonadaceae bacterium]